MAHKQKRKDRYRTVVYYFISCWIGRLVALNTERYSRASKGIDFKHWLLKQTHAQRPAVHFNVFTATHLTHRELFLPLMHACALSKAEMREIFSNGKDCCMCFCSIQLNLVIIKLHPTRKYFCYIQYLL